MPSGNANGPDIPQWCDPWPLRESIDIFRGPDAGVGRHVSRANRR